MKYVAIALFLALSGCSSLLVDCDRERNSIFCGN